jgi:hypothetical protein
MRRALGFAAGLTFLASGCSAEAAPGPDPNEARLAIAQGVTCVVQNVKNQGPWEHKRGPEERPPREVVRVTLRLGATAAAQEARKPFEAEDAPVRWYPLGGVAELIPSKGTQDTLAQPGLPIRGSGQQLQPEQWIGDGDPATATGTMTLLPLEGYPAGEKIALFAGHEVNTSDDHALTVSTGYTFCGTLVRQPGADGTPEWAVDQTSPSLPNRLETRQLPWQR